MCECNLISVLVVNFSGIAIGPTSIYLTWALPSVPGLAREYRHYIVHCDEAPTSREWTFFAVEPHTTVISLHPYYEYDCRIAIVGNATYPYSTPVTVLTRQAGDHYLKYARTILHNFISSQCCTTKSDGVHSVIYDAELYMVSSIN